MSQNERKSKRRPVKYEWDRQQIRALRQYLQQTQRELADELQVRQQTISEWETGMHQPHRSMQKLLTMIAERAGFQYNPTTTAMDDTTSPPSETP